MTRDLLLFPIGSATFGIWEQEISSVAAVRPLHRLPLSPKAVAGIAVIDDHSATIFDLAACLGMDANSSPEHSRFLLLNEGSSVTGYAISGKIETWRCTDDRLRPMPAAVRMSVVDTAAVRGNTVIPIIHIRKLHERLHAGILDVPAPERALPERERSAAVPASFRFVDLGGDEFCMAGDGVTVVDREGIPVTGLPFARARAEGVLVHEGAVLPVIALGARTGPHDRLSGHSFLFTNISGERYALEVDGDLGELNERDCVLLVLPPLARTAGIREAVIREGKVIPMLDLAAFVVDREGDAPPAPAAAYTPASDFSARFQAGNVEIMELSLLGVHHAVPREQVKEDFPPVPFRSLPGLPEIVIGVAECGGQLLPVVDLAAIFGKRTKITERSRMLRLNNGDFHALVLIEETGEVRVLTPDMQRRLPIAIPHEVLYGCYLDERIVRLILNVHALAVHFERTELRELVASLAPLPEVTRALTADENAARNEQDQDEQAVTDDAVLQERPRSEAPHWVPGRRSAASAVSEAARSEREDRERQRAAEAAAAEEERNERSDAEQAREQQGLKEAEAERLREEEAARARAEAEAAEKAEEDRRVAAAEAAAKAEEARRIAEAEAAAKAEAERRAAEEKEREEAAAHARAQAEAAARTAGEMKERAESEQRMREESKALEEAAARLREDDARKQEAPMPAAAIDKGQGLAERSGKVLSEEVRSAEEGEGPSVRRKAPVRSVRARTIAAVIGAVLVLLLFWLGGREERPVPAPAPVQKEEPATQETEAPLVLNVPPSMPKPEVVIYVVVKGDTLWAISKRFTGNPLNYPRVAKDNSIATPDLIFPGQRIRLVKQQ